MLSSAHHYAHLKKQAPRPAVPVEHGPEIRPLLNIHALLTTYIPTLPPTTEP